MLSHRCTWAKPLQAAGESMSLREQPGEVSGAISVVLIGMRGSGACLVDVHALGAAAFGQLLKDAPQGTDHACLHQVRAACKQALMCVRAHPPAAPSSWQQYCARP